MLSRSHLYGNSPFQLKRSARVAIVQHRPNLSPYALSLSAKTSYADRFFQDDNTLYHKGRQVSPSMLELYDLIHDETGFQKPASSTGSYATSLPLLPVVDTPRHVPLTRERRARAELMMDNRKMSLLNLRTPRRTVVSLTGNLFVDQSRIKESLHYPFTGRPVNALTPPTLSQLRKKYPDNIQSQSVRTIHNDEDLKDFLSGHHRSVMLEEYLPGITAWVLIVPGLRGELTYTAIPVGKTSVNSYKPLNLNEPLKSMLLEAALETAETLFVERMVLASFRLTSEGEIVLLKVNPFPSELEGSQFIASLTASGITYDELTENVFNQAGL